MGMVFLICVEMVRLENEGVGGWGVCAPSSESQHPSSVPGSDFHTHTLLLTGAPAADVHTHTHTLSWI